MRNSLHPHLPDRSRRCGTNFRVRRCDNSADTDALATLLQRGRLRHDPVRGVTVPTFRILLAAAMLVLAGAVFAEIRIIPQDSGVKVRLRGISAVSTDVAWASGREGTVLRTIDGGKVWQAIKVPGAGELDFRDVEGFDADTAVILSIGPGEASRVYRTEDAGKTWKLSLQNRDPRAFLDCMAFEGERGWMLGDPVDGRFQIHETQDGGRSWRLLSEGPKAVDGEAAFAASGTCIAVTDRTIAIATGGEIARAHVRSAKDGSWLASNPSRIEKGSPRGFFSIARSGSNALMVGGDYEMTTAPGISTTLLKTELRQGKPPRGYRSGVACANDTLPCIATGPSGTDLWNGKKWRAISDQGYDAIDLVDERGWASGDAGRIARIEISQ